jgi:integrase/recombinase XerD
MGEFHHSPLLFTASQEATDALSGREGANRSRGKNSQIEANTDQEAVSAWLARYVDSPNTLSNCRREAERLLLWSMFERRKPLSSLDHEDMRSYWRFLADPQPAERWVMAPGRKHGRLHPGWRPFAGPLSEASIRQAMFVLNTMMSWLVRVGYLAGNPLLSLGRRKTSTSRATRLLEDDLWTAVRDTVLALPRETQRQLAAYARTRWLFSLLGISCLRISEVLGGEMGDFLMLSDPKTGEQRWWLKVLGKGGKERLIPAPPQLMVEVVSYRRALGLADLPTGTERSPLLFPVDWHQSSRPTGEWPKAITRSAVHVIVKEVFRAAAERWLSEGGDQAQADRLNAGSAEWLRHTTGFPWSPTS